jgi:hypothetical protein
MAPTEVRGVATIQEEQKRRWSAMRACVKSEEIGASLGQCERRDNSFQGGREMLKTHIWRTASLVIALTAIVGLALPALAEDWRTFRGHVDEMLTGAPPVDDDCLKSCQVTAVGAGRATPLGRFTRLSCVVVHEDGSPEGITELTAANGDKLCAEGKGEPPTGLTVHGTYKFTGGTGRFSDVSGGAYFVGVITSDDSGTHIAVDFGGIIQY